VAGQSASGNGCTTVPGALPFAMEPNRTSGSPGQHGKRQRCRDDAQNRAKNERGGTFHRHADGRIPESIRVKYNYRAFFQIPLQRQ
jgi:hypothetical protein